MRRSALMLVVAAVFAVVSFGCGGGGGGKTPKDAVEGMFKAAKAGDWEKAVSYIDIDGMSKELKAKTEKMTEGMDEIPEDLKKKMDEQLAELSPEKLKKSFIDEMKKDESMKDFTYEITDVGEEKDGVVTVTVKVKPKDGEEDEQDIPVKKVGSVWKVAYPTGGMDMD